jgi:integral membrane protein (TIGR01906 family)
MTDNTPSPISSMAQFFLPIALPIILVILAVRFVMSPLFLQFEYLRSGFPVDTYGFTTQDRLYYAQYALDYLIFNHNITYLADLTFPDGTSLYNVRELHHMRDVQVLTQVAYIIAALCALASIILMVTLWRKQHYTAVLRSVRNGASLTLMLIVGIVILAVVGWEFFFTGFHQLFFADGTWYFLYSDTLIRLFPEQFWFDAALTIGGLSALSALAIYFTTQWLLRKHSAT